VRVGLIADGVHVDRRAVALAARALGGRLTLVTDAVAPLGVPAGPAGTTARLGTSGPVTVRDRALRLADGTLAGSVLALDGAVRNLVAFGGVDLAAAVRAATSVPAAVLGAGDRGAIVEGAVGDLVLLDDAGDVVVTVVGGDVAHDRRAAPPAI
jgi:N-acetylglucosamine-6-phosphate deacetylase